MAKSLFNRDQSSDERIDELLSAYLDGVLALQERAELEARLQHDSALVARLEALRSTKKALARLPQVDVPRNFILSPAMVAPPHKAAPSRQRRTWPVFGWAAAAVTLVFLLVFAGDVFVISPSVRPRKAVVATEPVAKMLMEQAGDADEAREPEAIPPATQPAQTLFQVQPTLVVVETETVELETAVEAEVTLEKEGVAATVELVETEVPAAAPQESLSTARAAATSPPGGGGGERPASTAIEEELPAPAPGDMAVTQTPPLLLERATPAPTFALGSAAEIKGDAVGSPEPTIAPIEDREQTGVDETPETVAVVVPVDATPEQDTDRDADRVLSWLRWIEAGLAIFAIVLGTTTLILRRRES